MVKLENLCISLSAYPVVHDISLDVAQGELVCLLGPSGCGKTTTLRAIAGFELPQSGSISIADQVVSGGAKFIAPQDRGIGFLFQDFALFPHLNIAANIGFGLSRLPAPDAKQRITEMLERVGLTKHADKYPHMLSGGQQQRVALARALAPKPRLMLLDEPFSDLDTSLRARIREDTLRILKETGVTTIVVTHDPEEAMLMADRIALMRAGEIVQVGTPENLYHAPTDGPTAAFFGDVNHLHGVVRDGCIDTAVGPLRIDGYADGSKLDVYVRPDAVSLAQPDDPRGGLTRLQVCSVRFAGSNSLVQLGIEHADSSHEHLAARLPGRFESRIGDAVDVVIDPRRAYIFETTD